MHCDWSFNSDNLDWKISNSVDWCMLTIWWNVQQLHSSLFKMMIWWWVALSSYKWHSLFILNPFNIKTFYFQLAPDWLYWASNLSPTDQQWLDSNAPTMTNSINIPLMHLHWSFLNQYNAMQCTIAVNLFLINFNLPISIVEREFESFFVCGGWAQASNLNWLDCVKQKDTRLISQMATAANYNRSPLCSVGIKEIAPQHVIVHQIWLRALWFFFLWLFCAHSNRAHLNWMMTRRILIDCWCSTQFDNDFSWRFSFGLCWKVTQSTPETRTAFNMEYKYNLFVQLFEKKVVNYSVECKRL